MRMSLALALLVTTPRFTILSYLDRRGFAPSSSYELGRGFLRELDPSTSLWKRPRGWRGLSCGPGDPLEVVDDAGGVDSRE